MAARKKKPKLPPAPVAHPCVILSVDTAQRSGWSVHVDGELISSGEVDMLDPFKSSPLCGADRVCLHALWECSFDSRVAPYADAVLVFERPFRGTTQGQWIGAWKQAWSLNGGNKRRVVGVYPATWRSRLLDRGASRAPRDVVRAMELRKASAIAGRAVEPDEAAAILVGKWACHAAEVGAVLPRPRRRKVA